MKSNIKKIGIALSLLALPSLSIAQTAFEKNYEAIKAEVKRTKEKIELNTKKPFIVGTNVILSSNFNCKAEMGNLVFSNNDGKPNSFTYSFSILIGDYNRVQMHNPRLSQRNSMTPPFLLEENTLATQTLSWFLLDQMFKQAVMGYDQRLGQIAQNNYPQEELTVPELMPIVPLKMAEQPPIPTSFDVKKWEDIACKLSAIFLKYADLERTSIQINASNWVNRAYTTEGSEYWTTDINYNVMVNGAIKDNNGSYVTDNRVFVFKNLDPNTAFSDLTPKIEAFAQYLSKIPTISRVDELYTGPVLFEDQAVVDIIYYNIIPMVTATRPPLGSMSGKNDERIGKTVFSPLLSVKDLSGSQTYKGAELPGYYPIDDDGVTPPAELSLVENGKLTNLLMGRVPMKNYRKGNGHFRNGGNNIGNLFVTIKGAKSYKSLRKEFINRVKKAGEPYAYIINRVIHTNIHQVTRIDVKTGEETLMREGALDASSSPFRNILGASKEVYEQTDYIGCRIYYNVPKAIVLDNIKIDRKALATPEKEPIVSRPIPSI